MKNLQDMTNLFKENEKYNNIDCLCEDRNVPIKNFDPWNDNPDLKEERGLVTAFKKDNVV
jgi:hypothetical protein